MQIRLAAYLQTDSIVDGEGIRTVIWTQGCPHHCLGCHNQETHDVNGGALVDLEEIYDIIDNLEGQDGITFSGGDPFVQPLACATIAKYARKKGYNIWSYTGYTFEELLKDSQKNQEIMDFLNQIDVLVDGRFILSKKDYSLKFAGSSNQRIIDVKESLKQKKVIILEKFMITKEKSGREHPPGIYV